MMPCMSPKSDQPACEHGIQLLFVEQGPGIQVRLAQCRECSAGLFQVCLDGAVVQSFEAVYHRVGLKNRVGR